MCQNMSFYQQRHPTTTIIKNTVTAKSKPMLTSRGRRLPQILALHFRSFYLLKNETNNNKESLRQNKDNSKLSLHLLSQQR